jgi:hypothetical protein
VKQGEAARRPPHTVSITHDDDSPIITEQPFSSRADHRRRDIQRLSTIAQVLAFYGPETVQVLPPGPDVCPPWCPYCYRQRAGAVVA